MHVSVNFYKVFMLGKDAKNCQVLFTSLDRIEAILSNKAYLVGGTLTEADIRLFTTIVRCII